MASLYSCKKNWWKTDTSPYLWGSWGGKYGDNKIDYDCLAARGRRALAATDFAGIAVNLLLLVFASVLGGWWGRPRSAERSRPPWLFVFTFLWALANYSEAFSYLVLNTIWLKSDMETVVVASRVSRWVWAGLSLLLAIVVARWLRHPAARAATILGADGAANRVWTILFAVYVAVVGIIMASARILLT